MKTLVVEHTAPFQGLPELVADTEGLFTKEAIKIEWVDTDEGANRNARTSSSVLPTSVAICRSENPMDLAL